MKKILLMLCAAAMAVGASGANTSQVYKKTAQPKFAWRGYMMDCSRHFFTVKEIKKQLDLMSAFGLNVFHWHLIDGQGWRLQIDAYPELTKRGATRTDSTKRVTTMGAHNVDGQYGPFFYTKDEVRDILKYAKARGIRVVPEIEMPGHSFAALLAYPELCCEGLGNNGEMCLGKDSTLKMMQNILDEVCELFPDQVIHIGGDECTMNNWKKCAACQKRIKDNGLRDEKELQGWFTRKMAEYLEKKGKRMMGWDEIAEWDIPKSAIVMSYRGTAGGIKAVKKGHDVVMTPGGYCYLDYVQGLIGDPYEYQPFGTIVTTAKIANFNPCSGVPEELRSHVLGGQGNMWTELVPDLEGLEWRTWPRLAALADVLWNGTESDADAFLKRMQKAHKWLVAHKVNAAPLGPNFAYDYLPPGVKPKVYKPKSDFVKMLDNPLDETVVEWNWENKKDKYRKVYAKEDTKVATGSFVLELTWQSVELTVNSRNDTATIRRALALIKALARVKKGGHMEFQAAHIED